MEKRILLIDNDLDCLEIFEFILSAEGYEVKAVERTNTVPAINYDLIILDENLDGEQGSDYCATLKSNPETAHIVVVLTSASDSVKHIADSCHADYFLKKPFDIVQLETLVSDIFIKGSNEAQQQVDKS